MHRKSQSKIGRVRARRLEFNVPLGILYNKDALFCDMVPSRTAFNSFFMSFSLHSGIFTTGQN